MEAIVAEFPTFSSSQKMVLHFSGISIVCVKSTFKEKEMPADSVLRDKLRSGGVVCRESVTLRAGAKSDVYYDIKKAYGDPYLLSRIAERIVRELIPDTTCVAASGHGGLPLAGAIAFCKNLKLSLVRDQPKNHGRNTLIDGHLPTKNDLVVIVDDVLTSGSSLRRTYDVLREAGAGSIYGYVVLKRGSPELPFSHHSIFTEADFL